MRKTFINTLTELAAQDPRILLMTGDLGYMVLEPFIEKYPNRFFNVGVAEQNMVGLATGLAEAGFIPFVYSIATFASMRAYEFIRNGPILHQSQVRIIAVGGGFEYGHAGPTHHALEDIGIMRVQPNLTLIAPVDYQQTRTALLQTWDLPGPIYYRLGKDDTNSIAGLDGRFQIGHVEVILEGHDLLLISTGSITDEVITAAEMLNDQGIKCTIAVVACLNPPPSNDLTRLLKGFKFVFTVENHYVVGGIGSLISEVIAEQGLNCQLVRCGIRNISNGLSGSQNYLRNASGISANSLVTTIIQALN